MSDGIWGWLLTIALAALLVALAWTAVLAGEGLRPAPIATPTGIATAVGP